MYDVITVGSSTLDVFAKVESELVKIKTVHHTEQYIAYPCGSKILINDLKFFTGGGGTNTAVCLSRLGLKVAYMGKVGKDSNGKEILEELKHEKVNFLGKRGKGHSGYSIILDSLENDRTILAYKGVNNELSVEDINFKKLKTKWFYLSSMVEQAFETLEEIAAYAASQNIMLAFNPSNYLAEKGYLYLKEVLNKTNLLILNFEEAQLLSSKNKLEEIFVTLMSYGPKRVVITDGKNGAYTFEKNHLVHVLPNPVKVVESTGAGDAFASTLVAALIKKKSLEFALQLALINAESVIKNIGAKTGLYTWKKLLIQTNRKLPKIERMKI